MMLLIYLIVIFMRDGHLGRMYSEQLCPVFVC
jgi:hypothetical protein